MLVRVPFGVLKGWRCSQGATTSSVALADSACLAGGVGAVKQPVDWPCPNSLAATMVFPKSVKQGCGIARGFSPLL